MGCGQTSWTDVALVALLGVDLVVTKLLSVRLARSLRKLPAITVTPVLNVAVVDCSPSGEPRP